MKKWVQIILWQFIVASVSAPQWVPDLGNGTFKNPFVYADFDWFRVE
jgi:hypothetical protein